MFFFHNASFDLENIDHSVLNILNHSVLGQDKSECFSS